MKKKAPDRYFLPEFLRKMFMVVQLMFIVSLSYAATDNDTKLVTFVVKSENLNDVLIKFKDQTGVDILFNKQLIGDRKCSDFEVVNQPIEVILSKILEGTGFGFSKVDGVYVIKQNTDKTVQPVEPLSISGVVVGTDGEPLPGVTVLVKGTSWGSATDTEGRFKLSLPSQEKVVLVFSFVGMQTKELPYRGESEMKVVMETDVTEMEQVVVTGIFTRKAESYTGAATTIKKEELQKMGNQNVLQSLKSLDPAFHIIENNDFGSDPNKAPQIQLRGQQSMPDIKGTYNGNPNQPLFILDGFETDITTVYDLDMNRVETIVLLKDAAAKAIYGAKAANGVVVIETRQPKAGKMRISYKGDLSLTVPDLTGYNLCDAREKYEVDKVHGRYSDPWFWEQYLNNIQSEIERGVDTDWLAQPLHTGIGHRHNVKLEGGDKSFRYAVTLQYNHIAGVMKGSNRNNFNGGINLSYKHAKFIFRNSLSISLNKSEDSPYGSFDQYVKLNPYWTEKDENGNIINERISDDYSKASTSKYYQGNRIPDLYGSIGTDFSYKGIDLSILTTNSIGGKIYDGLYTGSMNAQYATNTWNKHQLRRWQQPGDVTDVPRVEINGSYATTDRILINASYFAIKNITLGYSLPKDWMRKAKLNNIRVFGSIDNLALFSHLQGMDPQYNFKGETDYSYAPNKTYSFGVEINF